MFVENLHRGTMIAFLWLICGGFPIVSSSEDIEISAGHNIEDIEISAGHNIEDIEISAGHNITLVPKYIGDSSGISWWFKGRILVDIKLGHSSRVYLYPKFDHFSDRTTINSSTGHMTIRNLTEEDSGHYRAEAVVNNTDQVTRIRLIVFAHSAKVMEESTGNSVILTPKYSGTPTEFSWWRGPNILAWAQLGHQPLADVAYYGLRESAKINPSTGSLTISHLMKSDAADYRAEVLVNNTIQYTAVKLTVIDQEVRGRRGISGGAIAVIVVAVLVNPIALLLVLSCKCGDTVTRFRGPPVVLVSMRCLNQMAPGTKMGKTENCHCDCISCQSSFPMQRFQEKTHWMEVTNHPATIPHVSVNDNGHRMKD